MPGILTVLEQRDGVVKRVSHEALAAARLLADELGCDVHALLIGPPGSDVDGLGQYGFGGYHDPDDDGLRILALDQRVQDVGRPEPGWHD